MKRKLLIRLRRLIFSLWTSEVEYEYLALWNAISVVLWYKSSWPSCLMENVLPFWRNHVCSTKHSPMKNLSVKIATNSQTPLLNKASSLETQLTQIYSYSLDLNCTNYLINRTPTTKWLKSLHGDDVFLDGILNFFPSNTETWLDLVDLPTFTLCLPELNRSSSSNLRPNPNHPLLCQF